MSCLDKEIYRFTNVDVTQCDSATVPSPLAFNQSCYKLLREQKDRITQYNNAKKWDKYKKSTNPFELIFTSSVGYPNISKYAPISRSYFKMWEILHDFRHEFADIMTQPSIRVCSVAEGPGGFIEAIVKYRTEVEQIQTGSDHVFGMTLISNNKNVPNWKFTRDFMKQYNITLCYGKDGTGSLYKPSNITQLADTAGRNSCDIVTGDGGFDYSNDFNEQEDASLPLMMCEVLAATILQKPGGIFILKIFDISHPRMFQLMYFLYKQYDQIAITKPFSSRPANSEKYVICSGFKGPNQQLQQQLLNAISLDNMNERPRDFIHVPARFMKEVVYYNTHYSINQILNISKTLEFIDECESHSKTNNNNYQQQVIHNQLEHAIRWCHKYNMPISPSSIKFYKSQYFTNTRTCSYGT